MANQSSISDPYISLAHARQDPGYARPVGDEAAVHAPARRRYVLQPGLDDALVRLGNKARGMKRARFNAQVRFEAKNRASILALTVVSILSIALSMYSGTHDGTAGFAAIKPFLDFMALSMSLLVLSFGFIVALGNYQDKALRMQRCAMDLTRLLDELENARMLSTATADQLSGWTTDYNDIVRQCPYNHSDVDSEKAGFTRNTPWHQKTQNAVWQFADVWGIHGFFFSFLRLSGWLPVKASLAIAAFLMLAIPAHAYDVDLEIVLAVDASGSVDDDEFKLQLRGIAEALRDPRIQNAIRSGPRQKVAMSMLVWSDAAFPKFMMQWEILSSPQSAISFASRVETFHEKAGRSRGLGGGGTAIGDAIAHAMRMMAGNGISARRQVVDVSGDGIETPPWHGDAVMLPEARQLAAATGVMVNGLAILNDFPNLDRYYQRNVIVGPGAFVIEARDYTDFKRAIREKMWLEIVTRVSEVR